MNKNPLLKINRKQVERGLLTDVLPRILVNVSTFPVVLLVDVSNTFSLYVKEHPRTRRFIEHYISSRESMGSACDPALRRFLLDQLDHFPHLTPADGVQIREAAEAKKILWVFIMQGSIENQTQLVTAHTFPRKPCIVVHVACVNKEGTDCFRTGDHKNPMDDYTLMFLNRRLQAQGISSFLITMDRFTDW